MKIFLLTIVLLLVSMVLSAPVCCTNCPNSSGQVQEVYNDLDQFEEDLDQVLGFGLPSRPGVPSRPGPSRNGPGIPTNPRTSNPLIGSGSKTPSATGHNNPTYDFMQQMINGGVLDRTASLTRIFMKQCYRKKVCALSCCHEYLYYEINDSRLFNKYETRCVNVTREGVKHLVLAAINDVYDTQLTQPTTAVLNTPPVTIPVVAHWRLTSAHITRNPALKSLVQSWPLPQPIRESIAAYILQNANQFFMTLERLCTVDLDKKPPREALNELFSSWATKNGLAGNTWWNNFKNLFMGMINEIAMIYATPCDCKIFEKDIPTPLHEEINLKCDGFKAICELAERSKSIGKFNVGTIHTPTPVGPVAGFDGIGGIGGNLGGNAGERPARFAGVNRQQ